MANLKIRAVLFQSHGWWVAQCLEYDIATQARTQADLLYELERIIVGHFLVSAEMGRRPFERLPRAPRRYWEMYDCAKPMTSRSLSGWQVPFEALPEIEVRLTPEED